MNSLDATIRSTKTKGQLSELRKKGFVPAIIYGGKENNQIISLSKKHLTNLINQENFASAVIKIIIEGKEINVLPVPAVPYATRCLPSAYESKSFF